MLHSVDIVIVDDSTDVELLTDTELLALCDDSGDDPCDSWQWVDDMYVVDFTGEPGWWDNAA